MEPIATELLSKLGPLGVILFVAWRVADRIVDRVVKALDRLGDRVDAGAEKSLAHNVQTAASIADIGERLAVIETRTERLDETPVLTPRGMYHRQKDSR